MISNTEKRLYEKEIKELNETIKELTMQLNIEKKFREDYHEILEEIKGMRDEYAGLLEITKKLKNEYEQYLYEIGKEVEPYVGDN